MQGVKGATEVAKAWVRREKLSRGSARTADGVYYLFDNAIVCDHCPIGMIAEARIFGDRTNATWFSFAGWVTQTTLRHLRVVTGLCGLSIVRGRPMFGFAPAGIGDRVELDSDDWYCWEKLQRLREAERTKQHATV